MKSREIPGGTGPDPGCRAGTRPAAARKGDRMTKTYRQGQILKLIRSKRITTQEELAQELKNSASPPRR